MNKHEWYERVMMAGLTSAAERTAFAVWKHHNHKSGDAWASLETMAETINRSVKTVRRGISDLAENGWLVVEEDDQGRAHFYASEDGDKIVQSRPDSGQNCPRSRTELSTPPIIEPIDSNPADEWVSFEEKVSTKWPTLMSTGGRRDRPGMQQLERLKKAYRSDAKLCLKEVNRQAGETTYALTPYLVDQAEKFAVSVRREAEQKAQADRHRRADDFGLAPELREVA